MNKTLTLGNYKEPLRPVPQGEGFGFYGALLTAENGNEIQCHKCGEVFQSLGGHLWKHGMDVRSYKANYNIAKSTALVGESTRALHIKGYQTKMKQWGENHMQEMRSSGGRANAALKAHLGKKWTQSEETLNKRGSCPAQILEKLRAVITTLGKTPTKYEFELLEPRYANLIRRVYGWRQALKLVNADVRKGKQQRHKVHRHRKVDLLNQLRAFKERFGRNPVTSDLRRPFLPSQRTWDRHFGGLPKARLQAGLK